MNRPSVTALLAHHASMAAIVQATAELEYCAVCLLPLHTHPRCFWCSVLLGPEHVEDVPLGWQPGDRRPIECNFCWYFRVRRSRAHVAS